MLLTVKQRILITLLENGPLQNNDIAKRVGITEQWCSQAISALNKEGLIEAELIPPRKINYLTNKGAEIAKSLREISRKTEAKTH